MLKMQASLLLVNMHHLRAKCWFSDYCLSQYNSMARVKTQFTISLAIA